MSEEFKCPYCEGTASIAYHRTGNNLLYCHDCKKTFSEVGAKIMKQDARLAELEAERDRLRETICRIERKINSAKTACPPFVQREFEEAQKWAYEALKGAGDE